MSFETFRILLPTVIFICVFYGSAFHNIVENTRLKRVTSNTFEIVKTDTFKNLKNVWIRDAAGKVHKFALNTHQYEDLLLELDFREHGI